MNDFKNLLAFCSFIMIIIAFLFVGIYPYIQIHNKSLADKLEVWYKIAQIIVDREASITDKSGEAKKETATTKLVKQAEFLKVPLNTTLASDLIEHAYKESKNK